MPFEVVLSGPPGGYAVTAAEAGSPISVAIKEFTSSEDREIFTSRLEGLPDLIRGLLPQAPLPSQVDHLVAIIQQDGRATVYLNECTVSIRGRVRGTLAAGEAVMEDDLMDINGLRFDGVTYPRDAGVLCVFSYKWRKGFFRGRPRRYLVAPRRGTSIRN